MHRTFTNGTPEKEKQTTSNSTSPATSPNTSTNQVPGVMSPSFAQRKAAFLLNEEILIPPSSFFTCKN